MTAARAVRVLVLDDDPLIRRAFERVAARRDDVALETVATPAEARARALGATEPFDLVVCDFHLKALGAGVTSEPLVRELHRLGVRVVIMTGDVQAVLGALRTLVPVFMKPVTLAELLAEARP